MFSALALLVTEVLACTAVTPQADFDTLNEMLKGAKDLLAHAVDENRRR